MQFGRLRFASPRGLCALVLAAALSSPAVLAGQSTPSATMDLTLTLITPAPTCTATVDDVDFGQLDAGSQVTGINYHSFNVDFDCSGAVAAATATFDGGLNPNAPNRRMSGPSSETVGYSLFDPAADVIMIDETLTLALPAGTSSVPLQAYVGVQTLPSTVGAYSDQVTVTFTF